MSGSKFELKVSEDDSDVAYLKLPNHPSSDLHSIVSKQVNLRDVIKDYKGADVYLDFGHDGKLIGIEVLA